MYTKYVHGGTKAQKTLGCTPHYVKTHWIGERIIIYTKKLQRIYTKKPIRALRGVAGGVPFCEGPDFPLIRPMT